ncbi:MAG TPA: ABC transporter permease [Ardenticatenaceae bacterium]
MRRIVEAALAREEQARRGGGTWQGWRENGALLAASLPLLLFLALPLVALVLRVSPANVLANVMDRTVAQAIGLSMVTTAITTVVTIAAGTPIAYLLARRRFRGWAAVDTLIDLPMVLPPSVAGIALLVAFGRRGLLGPVLTDLGIEVAFTQAAVVLAQTFVAAPFYVKAAMVGFAGVERELEQAAALDGASGRQVFRYVTLPLSGTALVGGAVMTWARALGEFGATIIFAGNFPGRTQTMPLAIYLGFEMELNVALTLAVILLALSFAVLFVVKGVLRQHLAVL